jgi:hypothetical protein
VTNLLDLPATFHAVPLGEADEEVQQKPAQQQRPEASQECTGVESACVLVAGEEAGHEGERALRLFMRGPFQAG